MKRGLFLFGAFLFAAGPAAAQDISAQDEMRFVQGLRDQGKSDLALEYLQRLAKNPSPELAKELPLELAKARLEAANEEPDSGKRLGLYAEAREEFQKWLQANPGHPRAGEVNLDLAHVTVLQGRTQLSRAYLNPDFKTEIVPEAVQARAIFEDAGAQLKVAAKGLDDQSAKAADALKKKLDHDRLQAELDIDVNVFDQAQTYPLNGEGDIAKARNQLYQDAETALQKLGAKDDQEPICWTAKAWAARCLHMLGDFPKAKERYKQILNADKRYANEGQRLARYFYLLLLDETASELRDKDEDDAHIIEKAKSWMTEYAGYLKTPEGYGIRYLAAEEHARLAGEDKDATKRATDLAEARRLLRQVEQSENEFTDRARRLKIQVIATQQGGFKEPVDSLKNFEDCYVRAQYELMKADEDDKDAKVEDKEKKRKEHQAIVVAALERGLKLADPTKAHGEDALEVGNAKAMLAFQYLNSKKYREAIALADTFAKSDPRSAQASAAAVYALQAWAEMVSNEEAAGDTPPDQLKKDKDALFAFAAYMEKTWPKEAPADMARHQLALLYFNSKDADKRDANVQQAILALGRITPAYANYTVTQYQLAQFCFAADKDKVAPLPGDADDGYKKRALAALENIPALAAGADPVTNKVYFLAKIRLAQEDFTLKKYDELEQLTQTLSPLLAGKVLDADPTANDKLHGEIEDSVKGFKLYARWAKADAEAKAADKAEAKDRPAHYTKIMELLDPVVDEILAKQHPELKSNPSLARGILDNDLRATIQLNKLDRTKVVLNGYKELAGGDAPDAGAAEVLKQLVVFIPPQLDELKRTGDAAAVEAAKKEFSSILADTLKPLQGDKLTPKLVYFTAKIYSSMDKHQEAADLLDRVPEPAKDAQPSDTDLYQSIRVQVVHERRLNNELKEARAAMDAIMGPPPPQPGGWGRKKIDALMENVELLGAEGAHKQAAEVANALVQKLLPKVDTDNKIKELYLQCYYLVVENLYRQAVQLKEKSADKYNAEVKKAAVYSVDLAKKQGGFVTDATRGRFRDLMDAEPDLKAAFLEAYLTAVETQDKEAAAVKDDKQRDKATSDVAALIVELERLWPDGGGAAAKDRVTALLGGDAALKAACDKLKGTAMAP